MYLKKIAPIFLTLIVFTSCKKDNNTLQDFTPFPLTAENSSFPAPSIPSDNPLTESKIALGKKLFNDNRLSSDNSISCVSCHSQSRAFSDQNRFSTGVNGATGTRQGMAIFNLAYHKGGFFWDGRATTLREQALGPIENPLEMNETLPNVIKKINQDSDYLNAFSLAFGSQDITADRIGLALENFMLSIISNNSKYDQFLAGNATLSETEERGRQLFFGNRNNPNQGGRRGADCVRCHEGPNFDNERFFNIGLDLDGDITDIGRQSVTGNANDRGKFKTVSLRNIAVSAPYMHDGRFNNLNEVLNHYNNGIKESSTLDQGLRNAANNGMRLSQQDRTDIINFLNTLTDFTYLNNTGYSSI